MRITKKRADKARILTHAGITHEKKAGPSPAFAEAALLTVDTALVTTLTTSLTTALATPLTATAVAAAAGLATFAASLTRFVRVELMGRALFVCCLTALAAGLARFFGRELMGRSLLVGRPAAFAGDFTLAHRIHRSKAPSG
jgi:hypothetical protein